MKAIHCKNPKSEIRNPKLRKGFTLLEIMIALVIIGAVVTVILHTVNYHADVAYEHSVDTRMFFIAKEKITEMELKPKNSKGFIHGTNLTYENSVNDTEDEGIIELKTIIDGYGKKIVLSKLVIRKEAQNPK